MKTLQTAQNIAILWFWKEWFSTLKFLLKNNIKNITILDGKNPEDKEKLDFVTQNNIKNIFWSEYLDTLENYDLIIKSPGITPYNEKILPFKDRLTSQTQIFFDNYKWKVVWITGSKGKSTTSTLAYGFLSSISPKVRLVWNIWTPVLDEIDVNSTDVYDYIVYELSSYMLEWLKPKLYVSILNNIYDVHLDWHHWKVNYSQAKENILLNSENRLVNFELSTNNLITKYDNLNYFWDNWKYSYKDAWFYINEKLVLKDENIALEWHHNRKNITSIIWLLDIVSDESTFENNLDKLKIILATFGWLPNRIEDIWTYNGIKFINDAMATTPESTMAALQTFGDKIGTLFLWWQDSGFTFDELRKAITSHNIKNLVLFPDTWEKIFWDLSKYDYETEFDLDLWEYKPHVLKTRTMRNAVDFAYKNTEIWKIVLLSSAAPSFSVWKNYQDKADQFINEVKNYKN